MPIIERIQLSLGGFLSIGRVSSQQASAYGRTLNRVSIAIKGTNSIGTPIGLQIQLDSVSQPTIYLLPAGLVYSDSNSSLQVPSNSKVSFIITAPTDPVPVDIDVWLEFSVNEQQDALDTTDCGLGTLGELKRFCITSGLVADTTYNNVLAHIGLGTAKSFDNATGKKFKRGVSVMEQFSFSRRTIVVAHTPIESISKLEVKYSEAEGWIDLTTGLGLCLVDNVEGFVKIPDDFWRVSGQYRSNPPGLGRLTLTGGYWYDPTDSGTGILPTGAYLLPEDLKLGWLLQCQHLWVNRDNLGITWSPTGEAHDTRKSLLNVKMLPSVSHTLTEYAHSANFR